MISCEISALFECIRARLESANLKRVITQALHALMYWI